MSVLVGLLWIVPSDDDYRLSRISADHHLGCGYLAAYLEHHGIPTKQYLAESMRPADVARLLVEDGVRVVGLSIKDTNYYAARWIADAVKTIDASVVIVAGGLTATFSDDLVLRLCASIDCCVRGYGEETLHNVVTAVLDGGDVSAIPGVTTRARDSTLRTPAQPSHSGFTLDSLPSPYLTGTLPGSAGPKIGISTSRGCVFRCTFCNPTAMAGFRIAYHSDDRVVDEIHCISQSLKDRAEPRMLFLSEDVFALNLSRTERLCQRIAADRPRNLVFGCETRIEHLTETALTAMWGAGFRFLKFGLESGSPRVLNAIKKVRAVDGVGDDYRVEREFLVQVADVVAAAKRIGFYVVAGAIFGLPGERIEDAIETLDFLLRIDVDEYYHNYLHIFPGTEIFATYQQWGYTVEIRDTLYPTIYRTHWPYAVDAVPRLHQKLKRRFSRSIVHL